MYTSGAFVRVLEVPRCVIFDQGKLRNGMLYLRLYDAELIEYPKYVCPALMHSRLQYKYLFKNAKTLIIEDSFMNFE